ncbi:ricin-type beta-trefoil lectin domain protein [Streptomyces sp. BE20]|uniref:ricin-type beta-trefoil lectin domain protein n=1 Tax=Streptomyces sp. BE20 TaxID=3002525 RepID=UPI002E780082|nr:ricin-type beta-trefoil lectin domain protein [Streptomyces sp. BE20]MEE1825717.1 ricin-type beta-trefoil lectin domain protein [Streptomyces sp. BE20]
MRRTAALFSTVLLGAAAAIVAPAATAQAAPTAPTAQAAPAGAEVLAGTCYAYTSGWNAYGQCSGIDPLQTWYITATCQYLSNGHPFNRFVSSYSWVGDGSVSLSCNVNETAMAAGVIAGPKLPPQPAGPIGQISGYAGKCVDVKGASSADRTPVQIYDCNGTNAQQWKIAVDGTVRALNKCLDVTGAATANGTKVQLFTCNGTGAQQWQVRADGSILNPQSGRCLDNLGFVATSGNQLGIWDCNGADNQIWHVPA